MAVVLSGPEFSHTASATFRNVSRGVPQTSSTSSGVYRAKCRRNICQTHLGSRKAGSVLAGGGTSSFTIWAYGLLAFSFLLGGRPPLSSPSIRPGLSRLSVVPLSYRHL